MQDYLTPCEVVEGNADCWTSMINGWPPYFNINPVPPITNWWIRMPLQGAKISFGNTQGMVRQWATLPGMLKQMPESYSTPWYFQLEGPDLIDPTVSMTARLELYTDAPGTLIFDNYDECVPKNHERTHRGEVRCHWLQHETTDVTASMRSDHEKQD